MIQTLIFSIWMAFPMYMPMESLTQESSHASQVSLETTTWKGTLDIGGPKLRLEVDIADDGSDLTGELRSLDQNNATLELAKIKLDGRIFSFEVPQLGAKFQGKLDANGTRVEGTFSQSGRNIPLVLTTDSKVPETGGEESTVDSYEQLGKLVEQYVDQDQALGGELHVIKDGKTVYHESFGLAHIEDKQNWENDTLCNIRSMTKPITSAAAQILIDRDELDLDAPVAQYLESFNNEKSKAITVRQVLTHRSGLPLTVITTSVDQYASLTDLVAAAGEQGPEFEPGSKFWYSDVGSDVVAALVAKISGEPIEKFVQREIFDPLGMANTFYGIDASDKRLLSAASGYMKMPKEWIRFWNPEKPLYPFAWGSQTVYSTTTDYAKFLKMLVNRGKVGDRQLLSTDAVDRMLEPVSQAKMMGSDNYMPTGFRNLKVYYGQMMITYRDKADKNAKPVAIGHSGSDGTIAWAWPDRDLMILYFTQSRGGMTPLKIEDPIDRLIIHPGADEKVPERLQPYLGTFVANYDTFEGEEFTVTTKNGSLVLDVPSQMAFELKDEDGKGFWAFAIAPDQIKAKFDRNEKNEVVGLKLHKGGNIFEVPRKGTARAAELTQQRIASVAAAKEKKSNEKLEAAWVGKLELGAVQPVMQFRVVKTVSGETVAYFDSISEGQTGFEATWSIVGDTLKFNVPKIKLKYRGKLNKAQDSAVGTWSQGGREFPLTLKKQQKEYEK